MSSASARLQPVLLADNRLRNWAMHYGTGASVGVLRGIMAHANLRGPTASALFTAVRLSVDQTLETPRAPGRRPRAGRVTSS